MINRCNPFFTIGWALNELAAGVITTNERSYYHKLSRHRERVETVNSRFNIKDLIILVNINLLTSCVSR
jgi:hypothetical protein